MNDNIREYLDRGEINYIGKVDSARTYAGRERIRFKWLVNNDPRIEQCRIYWNNNRDSASFPVHPSLLDKDGFMSATLDIPEGSYAFSMYHTGARGYRSISEEVTGTSYGEIYESYLLKRFVKRASYDDDEGCLHIEWYSADAGEAGIVLNYTDTDGNSGSLLVAPKETATTIPSMKVGEPVFYSTMYKPDVTAIDTFYVPKASIRYNANITASSGLKNTQMPFQAAGPPVFAIFAPIADWIVSENINANGCVNTDSGRNNIMLWVYPGYSPVGEIINGKFYQTVELEAGTYRFDVTSYGSHTPGPGYSAYIVAARGNSLPDVDGVEHASLGYTVIPVGVTAGTVLPCNFVLNEKSAVSLGFVVNLRGEQQLYFSKMELFKDF